MKILFILISLTLIQGSEAKLPREIELAIERKFDEKVVDMVFGVNETKEIIYPKIVVTPDRVKFMDEEGKILSQVAYPENSKIIFSQKGCFVGIEKFFLNSTLLKSTLEIKLDIFNDKGERLWELPITWGYDDPLPGFYISDKDGSLVLSDNSEGVLYFYDSKGELRKKADLFVGDKWNNERSVSCCFSCDSDYFVVNALKNYDTQEGVGKSYIILFDSSGNEIWRRPLKEKISANVEISSSGNYIVASGYKVSKELGIESKSTFLLNKDGETIYRYPWLFRRAMFSSDDRFIALGEKNRARLIKIQTGEILWETEFTKRVRALDISRYGLVLVETARGKYKEGIFVYYDPEVTVITPGGEKIYEKEFTGSQFFTPYIKILDSGKGFGVGFTDRFLFYKEM